MAVELRKGQRVSLAKSMETGEVVINLNWSQGEKKGLFGTKKVNIDLDLGCFVEMTDGSKHVIQALGNAFGSQANPPYVSLDGDDRSGEATGGENLRMNGKMASQIKQILVYTFIYEGAANWQQADGIVTVKYPGGDDIVVRMDEHNNSLKMCAIARIVNEGGSFSAEKIVQYFGGHKDMDNAFGWGFKWQPGRK